MIVPIDIKDIPKYHGRLGLVEELRTFMSSGLPSAEYVIPEGCSIESVASTLHQLQSKYKFPVSVLRRNNRIFFIRND